MKIEVSKKELEIILRGLECICDELWETTQYYRDDLFNLRKRLEEFES